MLSVMKRPLTKAELILNLSHYRIEEDLGDKARFAGKNFRKPVME